jgi:HK97 gp10 family phage protein
VALLSIDLSEVHALARDLRAAGDSITAKAERVVAAGAQRVVAAAQAQAPVDTGALKSSISADVGGLRFEAGPSVEYGIYQELGTSEMPPQPFLGPGFDQVEPQIADALGDAGSRIL